MIRWLMRGRHVSGTALHRDSEGASAYLTGALHSTLLPMITPLASDIRSSSDTDDSDSPDGADGSEGLAVADDRRAELQVQVAALLAEKRELELALGTSSPTELAHLWRGRQDAASRTAQLMAEIAKLEANREELRVATGATTAQEIIVVVEELRAHLAALVTDARRHLDRRGQRLGEHEHHVGLPSPRQHLP